jgi:hypothetical protein
MASFWPRNRADAPSRLAIVLNGRRRSLRYRPRDVGQGERESLGDAQRGLGPGARFFEALALGRPGYVKALLYPNGRGADGPK